MYCISAAGETNRRPFTSIFVKTPPLNSDINSGPRIPP